ncbi:hypothetical protein [Terrarubrum flagellatum]|uniref:hypothetical protein n=1 Tax=Terrirubrum flagellatum TaxID=2895980 RepID=UPI003144DE63
MKTSLKWVAAAAILALSPAYALADGGRGLDDYKVHFDMIAQARTARLAPVAVPQFDAQAYAPQAPFAKDNVGVAIRDGQTANIFYAPRARVR